MTGGSEKQTSSRCSIVSRSSRRPDLPAGRPPRAGEVKEGRRPARRRRALSLTGLSTVAPFLRSRRRKRLDAEHGISPGLQPFWLLSGRNSTYPDVQISRDSSLLRGLDHVRGEWNLVTMAWNLKRMFTLIPAG
jgi:hypothetical protein